MPGILIRRHRQKSKVRISLAIVMLILLTHPLSAREFALHGAVGLTTQSPALFGAAFSANMRGDSREGSWYSDTQLLYHWLTNSSSGGEGGTSSTITLRSFELNWFLLLPIGSQGNPGFFLGSGNRIRCRRG